MLCTSMDRSIFVIDLRARKEIIKTTLMNKFSCCAWNPREPFNLIAGNEDTNVYGFDLRKMDKIRKIYKAHIGAVMDVDFSPTGREFASGSFDKTIRIFEVGGGQSREVYHGRRMQKVLAVMWSPDNQVGYL